jgi:hypothetical protein
MKRKPVKWWKIFCSLSSDRGLISRTYNRSKINKKRTINPINKWANDLKRHFSKEVQMLVNKFFKCYQEHANQNYI